MRLLAVFALLLFCATPNEAFGFKWSKCKKAFKSKIDAGGKKGTVADILVQMSVEYTSQATANASSSTTSFVSSTGSCAAFAKADEERKMFIADSIIELKMETAEGQGENISSLATLYGCEGGSREDFIRMLRTKRSEIFTEQEPSPESVNDRILNNIEGLQNLQCNVERT